MELEYCHGDNESMLNSILSGKSLDYTASLLPTDCVSTQQKHALPT